MKSEGINIPLENITGLGNSTGEAKALWMLNKFAEGYNDMYFVDDALPNVKAVKNVLEQLDIKSKVVQAKIKFSEGLNEEFKNLKKNPKIINRFAYVQLTILSIKKFFQIKEIYKIKLTAIKFNY